MRRAVECLALIAAGLVTAVAVAMTVPPAPDRLQLAPWSDRR